MNPDGIIFHSFWKGNKIEKIEGLLFTYYETGDLEKIMKPNFEILGLETYTEMENNDSIYVILRIKDC